jgi:hypothetical protein
VCSAAPVRNRRRSYPWLAEALTNRFESPVSETDRLSDRRQLNAYFLARSQDRLR